MMKLTSLGGQVVITLGFGPVDRGSILPTDISFTTQFMINTLAQGGNHIVKTDYTMNTMIPWDYNGPR